jgi:hypothetical protein
VNGLPLVGRGRMMHRNARPFRMVNSFLKSAVRAYHMISAQSPCFPGNSPHWLRHTAAAAKLTGLDRRRELSAA